MGFAPTWLRQVSPPASQNHFNHCSELISESAYIYDLRGFVLASINILMTPVVLQKQVRLPLGLQRYANMPRQCCVMLSSYALVLRFEFDSTTIGRPLDFHSTALRSVNDLRRRTDITFFPAVVDQSAHSET